MKPSQSQRSPDQILPDQILPDQIRSHGLLPSFDRRWFFLGFWVAVLLISIINTISYQNAAQLIENTNRSRQTYEVIKNLVDIFSSMTVAESGRRGYVFLDDPKEYFRYQEAIKQLPNEIQLLRAQLADNSAQLHRLIKLESLLTVRINLMQESIDLYQMDKAAMRSQKRITEESVELRGRIQLVINEMQTEEDKLLRRTIQRSQQSIEQRRSIELLLIFSSFAILFIISLLLYRQMIRRQQAETMQYSLIKEKELSELKLRFFSMVSHEFRTPLSVILGSAQLLSESHLWTKERRAKTIQRIQSSAKLMTRLLTDILTLTRAEAGKIEFKPEAIDVEAFCLNLVEDLKFSSEPSQMIKFLSQGHATYANLDEKLLYSILSNLIANSIKYSSVDSTIWLTLESHPDHTVFQVSDQGIGIPSEDQAHIYDLFYRGQNARAIAGTGLGLTVVKKCVELHQGEIFLISEVGIGTTFTVKIPQRIVHHL